MYTCTYLYVRIAAHTGLCHSPFATYSRQQPTATTADFLRKNLQNSNRFMTVQLTILDIYT